MLCGCKHWPNFIVVRLFQRLMNPSRDGGNLSGKFSGIILGESRSVDILTLELLDLQSPGVDGFHGI